MEIKDIAAVPKRDEIRFCIKKYGRKGNRRVQYLFIDGDDELTSGGLGGVLAKHIYEGDIIDVVEGGGNTQRMEVIARYETKVNRKMP